MNESAHYPPPDFGSPSPNSFQSFQQQSRSGSFHPTMWSWSETPTELSWDCGSSAGWYNGSAAGYGFPSDHGNHGPTRPYGQNFGHEWHQGGHRGGRQSYGAPNHHGKKKNRKEPEYSHFCDTCDRGFKNQEKFNEHVSQHVKCSVADCSFMAHEKIVSIHWKNNHAPGAKRIKLDTPEEIAKWREERRKNYPTLQNIEKKRKVLEVREETGAVLETAQFGRMRGRGRGRGRGHGWSNRGFQGQRSRGPHPSGCSATEKPKSLTQPCRDGDPLGALATSDHDSDREESRTGDLVVAPKQMSSALGSLVANYGSMSESDEEPEATPIQRQKDLVQENQDLLNLVPPKPHDKAPARGTEISSQSTERQKFFQPDSSLHTPKNSRRGRAGRGGWGGRHQNTPQSRRPTLLEMLLAPDIRHERNVLLQCVRYIVRNHFFGLESRHNQEKIENKGTIPITTGEHKGRQEEPLEKVKVVSLSPSSVSGEGHSAEGPTAVRDVGSLKGLQTSEVAADKQAHNILSDLGCPGGSNEHTVESAGNLMENTEETTARDSHCSDLTSTDRITPVSDMYDDEIWESPSILS